MSASTPPTSTRISLYVDQVLRDVPETRINPGGVDGAFAVVEVARGAHIAFDDPADLRAWAVTLSSLAHRLESAQAIAASPHEFVRPGQVSPERPASDKCVKCGYPHAHHPHGHQPTAGYRSRCALCGQKNPALYPHTTGGQS